MLARRCSLFLAASIALAVITFVPDQTLAQSQDSSAAQVAPSEKPATSMKFYCEVQGGISVPAGGGLSADFHDRDGIDAHLNGSWKNPTTQGVSGKWGMNLGWWSHDDPASFWGHLGGNFNFSYNQLDFQKGAGSFKATVTLTPQPGFSDEAVGAMSFASQGELYSVAYLFNYREGVLPDHMAPFGRLQFYGGLGPALMINTQQFTSVNFFISNASGKPGNPVPVEQDFGSQKETSLGLMVQLGANYFLTKNVYMKVSFDYRYFQSSFDLTGDGITHDHRISQSFGSELNYDNNLFGINLGAGFQF